MIKDGGRLVFDPTTGEKIKLTSDYILVEDEGYFEIGSTDCRFDGEAEIFLTGEDSYFYSLKPYICFILDCLLKVNVMMPRMLRVSDRNSSVSKPEELLKSMVKIV